MSMQACPDCGVKPGQYHEAGCDVERCPYCGGQLLSCLCGPEPPLDDRMPWTGTWPGKQQCREFGFYAKLVTGLGWVPCDEGDPEASEDLNSLQVLARWDRETKCFVRREIEPIPFDHAHYLVADTFEGVVVVRGDGGQTDRACVGDVRRPDGEIEVAVVRALARFEGRGWTFTEEQSDDVYYGFFEFLLGLHEFAER